MPRILIGPVLASAWLLLAASTATAATLKTIYNFRGKNAGVTPNGGVIEVNGLLYGTTSNGGEYGYGALFTLDPATGKAKTLHSFSGISPEGIAPYARLGYSNGILYGSTVTGGVSNDGTLFSTDIATNMTTTLYGFDNGSSEVFPSQIIASSTTLYFSTFYTNNGGEGGVFAFDLASRNVTPLYIFSGGSDGGNPLQIVIDNNTIYGITASGGSAKSGALFSIDLASGAETTLHSFGTGQDGAFPEGLSDDNGTLYIATLFGGTSGKGSIAAYNIAAGQESVLYNFTGGKNDCEPLTAPTIYKKILYGTTAGCGDEINVGEIYSLNPNTGKQHTLFGLKYTHQGFAGALTAGNGVLYGATMGGGYHQSGTVFQFTP